MHIEPGIVEGSKILLSYGWTFDHWNINGTESTDNPVTLTATDDLLVTAYFTHGGA